MGTTTQLLLIPPAMGALHLAIILLTFLGAVDGFAKTLKQPSEHSSVEQELALQDRKTAPALAQVSTKDDDSPSPDPADENQSIALPSWSSVEAFSKPGLILSKNAPCSPANHPTSKPKRRGLKQRQGATPKPKLFCPLPSAATTTTTDTDSQPSKNDGPDGQQPQTEKGQEQGLAPPDGSPPQPEEFKWPNMFKIPTNDGDSPACFEATNGQMPVGVCENPEQLPEPSRWDVFFQFNLDVEPRAWKLPDATLAWPGMRECVPRNNRGVWCCRFYVILMDGSGFGDICWLLSAIERLNLDGQGSWQQFVHPLLPGL